MSRQRQQIGSAGEKAAVRYLRKKGFKILEQIFTSPVGEIDIIVKDRQTIVFVEVKTRRSLSFGSARMAITPKKQRKISMVALYYLKTNQKMNQRARFDVVTVLSTAEEKTIDHIQNAFELAYK
jgi:putative endonuclease